MKTNPTEPLLPSQLLPCPFCGKQPHEYQFIDEAVFFYGSTLTTWHRAYCPTCDFGLKAQSHQALAERWNRRSP